MNRSSSCKLTGVSQEPQKFKVLGSKFKVDEAASNGAGAVPAASDTEVDPAGRIILARNETETRYFAVVNASASNQGVRLATPDFGKGVKAELRIGGAVRVSRPKVKLTEKQILDLMVTDTAAAEGGGDPEKVDVLPFFAPDAKPAPNFARRHLANAAQVTGFPDAIPLAPGEGCIVMLRVTTDGAKPGKREGSLVASMAGEPPAPQGGAASGRAARRDAAPPNAAATAGGPSNVAGNNHSTLQLFNLSTIVVDLTLPDLPIWVYAWGPFTSQFPFESETRFDNDVARVAELGISGFSYYCYYAPRGNAWDIRTWYELHYGYQMVFPLENDVAITPIYETMREAWEDYRMLAALRADGKDELLAELLKSYERATDYADWENVPNRSNFQSLHDTALGVFAR